MGVCDVRVSRFISGESRRIALAVGAGALAAAAQLLAPGAVGAQETTYTQSALPGITSEELFGIAVDQAGNVYAVDNTMNQVSVLEARGTTWGVVTSDVHRPFGAAVNNAGDLFVADLENQRILKFTGGGGLASVVLDDVPATAIDVDDAGALYFTAHSTNVGDPTPMNGVFKLDPGATTPVELPFNVSGWATGLAVGDDGAVYVSTFETPQVLKLGPGASAPVVLPFTNLASQGLGVEVDHAGNVYAATWDQTNTGRNKFAKLEPGAAESVALPVTGLKIPGDIAVTDDGSIYITNVDFSGLSSSVVVLTPTGAPEPCTTSVCGFGS